MTNNVHKIQLQIKAFNKALSRADKKGLVSDDLYEVITDLISPEHMTKGGYGKAGEKYLSGLSPRDLMAYSSDIEAARDLLRLDKIMDEFDVEDTVDKKALLWSMYNELMDAGIGFDSEQVRQVVDGEVKVDYREMMAKMFKRKTDKNFGLSDLDEWFERQERLE